MPTNETFRWWKYNQILSVHEGSANTWTHLVLCQKTLWNIQKGRESPTFKNPLLTPIRNAEEITLPKKQCWRKIKCFILNILLLVIFICFAVNTFVDPIKGPRYVSIVNWWLLPKIYNLIYKLLLSENCRFPRFENRRINCNLFLRLRILGGDSLCIGTFMSRAPIVNTQY